MTDALIEWLLHSFFPLFMFNALMPALRVGPEPDDAEGVKKEGAGAEGDESMEEEPGASNGAAADEEAQEEPVERDTEMEESLATSVSVDPLAAYDINVQQEGQAVQQYLALIDAQLQRSQ